MSRGIDPTSNATFSEAVLRIAADCMHKDGEVQPMVLAYNGQDIAVIAVPELGGPDKTRIYAMLRALFRASGVVRYAIAMEAWTAVESRENRSGLLPSEREDRGECIIVTAVDRDGQATRVLDIERDAEGKVTLVERTVAYDGVAGAATELLDA